MKIRRTLFLLAFAAMASQPAVAAKRSTAVKHAFAKQQACPATALHRLPCAGYRIDHKVPLDCGGPDSVANLQWLTIAAHAAKSKYERNGETCKHRTKGVVPV